MVLKGPGLKKVSLEMVFGAESFFSCEGSLSENTPKKKPVLPLQSRPAGTFVYGTDPLSLSHQAACPVRLFLHETYVLPTWVLQREQPVARA